jgi:hypothetical protein
MKINKSQFSKDQWNSQMHDIVKLL